LHQQVCLVIPILVLAKSDPNLSVFVQALNKAGLTNTLSGNGPFTVFAPTNTAFNAFLLANNYINLDAVPTASLKEILLNHVINGPKRSTDFATGYIKTNGKGTASSSNTLSMYINIANGVKLNGVSTVTTPNITGSNGIIHIVDAVIGLPTILTHCVANPNFSSLVTIITSTSGTFGNQAAVVSALSTNTAPLTVFAPTNTAIGVAVGTGGFANGATETQVTKVLQYHVTSAGNVLSTSLTEGQVVPMFTTPIQNVTIQLTGGPKIKDQANNISNITTTDIQCANGIIHGINKVLQPVL
jgi:uncharacterized surface protein with fasciclin (FAS1) repeats